MKLVTLEFEGIGSFADMMTIDFEALGCAGLFLIEGPTGSGKSTILDAIVFALYGSTAGSNSDLGRLDSHLRVRSRAPYVQLVFDVQGARYQIRRSPRHQRDKRRGSGTTDDNGSVSLVQLSPDVRDISHRAREVGDWVIEHIGLTKSQFAATIVLAQGEFASFLDANTEARALILEKVFGTQFYKEVEDQLAAMRRSAITSRQRAEEAVLETTQRCLGVLGLQPGEDDLQRIDVELTTLHAELNAAQQRCDSADRAVAAALESLRHGEALTAAQDRKRRLLEEQVVLASRREEVLRQKGAIADHERAVPITPSKNAWEVAWDRSTEASSQLRAARLRLEQMGLTADEPRAVEQRTQTIGALQAVLLIEQRIGPLRQAVGCARRSAEEAAAEVEGLDEQFDTVREQLGQAQLRAQSLTVPEEELSTLLLAEQRTQAALDTWAAIDSAQAQLSDAKREQACARREHEQATAELAAATRERDEDIAATLAAGLHDGQPCLVCGSCEHPDPARFGGSGSQRDLHACKAAVDVSAARLQAADAAVARVEGVLQAREDAPLEDQATLAQRLESVRSRIVACRELQASSAQARSMIDALRESRDVLSEQLTSARVAAETTRGAALQAESALNTAIEQVQQARGDHESVADRIVMLQAQVDAINDVLTSISADQRAREEVETAELLMDQIMHSVGFADIEAATAALLPAEDLEAYRGCVDRFTRECAELEASLAEVSDVDLDALVDVPQLRQQLTSLQAERAQAHESKGSIDYRLTEAAPLRDHLDSRLQELHEVRASTDAVIRMADFATATRSEVLHRVKLSSFVLMRRFQSVVDAANDRLDAISEGRYQLVVETNGLDNRGLAGLDLLIADQRTDKTRSTKSLSGGERFYVALALALGLADVVRSESGGVELGTLFIDEGFGSLDADTLEEVIDMLEQVRAGQDRVIGLVSHVDLLKQRVDARISVRRDPRHEAISTLRVSL